VVRNYGKSVQVLHKCKEEGDPFNLVLEASTLVENWSVKGDFQAIAAFTERLELLHNVAEEIKRCGVEERAKLLALEGTLDEVDAFRARVQALHKFAEKASELGLLDHARSLVKTLELAEVKKIRRACSGAAEVCRKGWQVGTPRSCSLAR
jgi:hypothetical protein